MKRFLLIRAGETRPICSTDADTRGEAIQSFLKDGAPIDNTGNGKDAAGNRLLIVEEFAPQF